MIQFIIALSFFIESLDSTVINTAIPSMAVSLAVNPLNLKIALISYLLSLAVFIPISGWFADKFGASKVFMTSCCIFAFGSLCCGFAQNIPQLVLGRLIQGSGGALGLPVGRLIIVRLFGRQNLIMAMNRIITIGAFGLMLGPAIGGYIAHYFSWQWIFWLNLPICALIFFLSYLKMPTIPPIPVAPLDKIGLFLFSSSLVGFTFGLSSLSQNKIPHGLTYCILIASILLMVLYFIHSKNVSAPIFNVRLFKTKTFRIAAMGNLLARLGFGSIPFLVPLLLQIGIGYSADIAGLMLTPVAIGVIGAKPVALRLLRYLGYKRYLTINTFLAGLSIWTFALIDIYTPMYAIYILTAISGFFMSMQFTAMSSLAYADLPADYLSSATSIMSTLQQLSQSFGVAIAAMMIYLFSSPTSQTPVFTVVDFHYAFLMMGIFTLASSLIFVRLKKEDGRHMLD